MKVQLIVSPGEALMLASTLDHVRKMMTFNESSLQWSLENDEQLRLSSKELMSLGYVAAALNEACVNEANRPRFAGYCKTF